MVNIVIREIEPRKQSFDLGGTSVTAVDRIPFEKKLTCAACIAMRTVREDKIDGIAMCAVDANVTEMQALLSFYTDANVDGMDKEMLYQLYDMLLYDPQYKVLSEFVDRDFMEVCSIAADMRDVLIRRIEKKNAGDPLSLLGAFLSDQKPEETIAQGREISEYLIDLMGKARKYDAQRAALRGGIQDDLRSGAITFAKKG